MLFNGEWYLDSDGLLRPVIRGEVATGSGSWVQVVFLVDTGAERTVFSACILAALGLPPVPSGDRLSGVGGTADSVTVETQIHLMRVTGEWVVFRGQFPAMTRPESLDMSVLGRDIINLFALVVDRPSDRVCLLGQRHRYTIETV